MADKTIEWLHAIRAQDANKPFFTYFSTGCSHAPHHVSEEWAAKYKGKFDQGWDKLREETFARQKELGVIPADAELTERDDAFPAWDDVPDKLKAYYARQMEVYAGYSENADHNVGRVIDAIDELGELDNTLDPLDLGRQRRQHGGHDHRLLQRADDAERDPADRRDAAAARGALRRGRGLGQRDDGAPLLGRLGLGGQHPVQVGQAGRLAPRRHPQPAGRPLARPDRGGRRAAIHFTHVIDIGPTILEIAGIPMPTHIDGIEQEPMHGVTFADSITDAEAPERHTQQYFETIGNRAMYKDGWWLSMRTERIPWVLTPDALKPYAPGVWDPDDDPTELYYLPDDFSQANDLAAENPEKVAGAEGALLGGGREVQGAAADGAAGGVLRHAAAAAGGRQLRVPRRRRRTCSRG